MQATEMQDQRWSSRVRRIPFRRVLGRASLFGSLVLFASWFVFLRPVALGGPAGYTIVTGASMEPGMLAGDLVVSMAQGSYQTGEAVVYRIPEGEDHAGRLVIHRIVEGDTSSGFVLQGDNAAHRDPWRVGPGDIVGRVQAQIPLGGRVLMLLRNPFVAGSLAAGFVFVLVVWPVAARPRDEEPAPDATPGNRAGAQPA